MPLSSEELKNQIKKFFHGEVFIDDKTLKTYSTDASAFTRRPTVVVWPKDSQDVKNLVAYVAENKKIHPELSITARSAGTDMSGGPLNDSIIIDFTKHMHGIIAFQGQKVKVLPGTFYRDFEKETLKRGLILPPYTASKSINAVGGMVGNNSAGEKTLQYGQTKNFVEELKVVFADGQERTIKPLSENEFRVEVEQGGFDGQIYQSLKKIIEEKGEVIKAGKPITSKNSAGYYIWDVYKNGQFDLNQIITGSQGTLGIVTEITFRLVPVKNKSKLVVVFLKDLSNLGQLVNTILKYKPEAIESYDDHTFKIALKFFTGFLKKKGIKGLFKYAISFLPEFFMVLTGGVPKLILLVEFAGQTEREINESAEKLVAELKEMNVKVRLARSPEESKKYWDVRHDSFALLREHVKGRRTAPFIDDIIVPTDSLPEFLPALNKILDEYDLTFTIAGHVGDGNFHIIPLMDFNDPETSEIIFELSEKVYDLVLEYHGSITAEHNDGIIRTPYLKQMYGPEMIEIFQQIKNTFDPQNIFNPGKKVGGTKEDIKKYLIKPDGQKGG